MQEIIDKPTTDEYFGGCPECGKAWNIRKSHAHGCSVHKTAWTVGSGLFSSWMWENEEIWERNLKELKAYRVVKAIYPPEENPAPEVLDANGERLPPWEDPAGETDDVVKDVLASIDKNRAKEDCSAVPPFSHPCRRRRWSAQ